MSAGRSGLGLRALAISLMASQSVSANEAGRIPAEEGYLLMNRLKYAYKGVISHKPSGAAAAKRASVKRRNVLKRQSGRR